jgi:hypothetical protein
MKAYVLTTGVIFGLLTVAHVWRMIVETSRVATEPWYLLITLLALGLGLWAAWLLRAGRGQPRR